MQDFFHQQYHSWSKSHQPVDEIRIFYQLQCLKHSNRCRIGRMYHLSHSLSYLVFSRTQIPISLPTEKNPLRFLFPCLLHAAIALVKSFKCNRTSALQLTHPINHHTRFTRRRNTQRGCSCSGDSHLLCPGCTSYFCLIRNETHSKGDAQKINVPVPLIIYQFQALKR